MGLMGKHMRRRWSAGLVAGLLACGVFGAAPVGAQSGPIIVPPVSSIVVGIPPGIPSVVVVIPGDSGVRSRDGVTWATSGRADVDVDVDRHHGQAAAR